MQNRLYKNKAVKQILSAVFVIIIMICLAQMRHKSFARSFGFPLCVLVGFILLLSNSSSTRETLLGELYSIEHSLDDRTCKLDNVDKSFAASEISCLHLCSTELASPGIFYNFDKAECTCCSEVYNAPDELLKEEGTRYFTKTERPRDCGDLGERGFFLSDVYKIFPNGKYGVDVFCDFGDRFGPWTVIQRRMNDSVSFDRSYSEYQVGFGDPRGSFWLGLDAISNITLGSTTYYELKEIVQEDDHGTLNTYIVYFDWFKVANASNEYVLNVSSVDGSGGDGEILLYNNGQPFSTPDRPMYRPPHDHCTSDSVKGGWWLKHCHVKHLNGLYGKLPSNSGIAKLPINRTPSKDNMVPFAEMKLKETK